jgi:hypothetical protein
MSCGFPKVRSQPEGSCNEMKQRATNWGKPFAQEFLYREHGAVSVLSQLSCPRSDAWCDVSRQGLDELIVLLAVYCNRRAHLASIGLAIRGDLRERRARVGGGNARALLFERSREDPRVSSTEVSGDRTASPVNPNRWRWGLGLSDTSGVTRSGHLRRHRPSVEIDPQRKSSGRIWCDAPLPLLM